MQSADSQRISRMLTPFIIIASAVIKAADAIMNRATNRRVCRFGKMMFPIASEHAKAAHHRAENTVDERRQENGQLFAAA